MNHNKELQEFEEILKYLVDSFGFNTFSRYVNPIANQTELIEGISFLKRHQGGDCLNFGKALMELSTNKNLKIIGALPQLEKCSKSQAEFMQYGHTAVVLSVNSDMYLAEPTMRIDKMIPIKNNSFVENSEQIYEIHNLSPKGFTLKTTTKSKYNIDSNNDFLFESLESDLCKDLAKKYRLIKRNLHVVNKVTENIPRYYLKYNVEINRYESNIPEIPTAITLEELPIYNNIWEKIFLIQNFGECIQNLMFNYQTYEQDLVQ